MAYRSAPVSFFLAGAVVSSLAIVTATAPTNIALATATARMVRSRGVSKRNRFMILLWLLSFICWCLPPVPCGKGGQNICTHAESSAGGSCTGKTAGGLLAGWQLLLGYWPRHKADCRFNDSIRYGRCSDTGWEPCPRNA